MQEKPIYLLIALAPLRAKTVDFFYCMMYSIDMGGRIMSLIDIIDVYDLYHICPSDDFPSRPSYLPENELHTALISVDTVECDCIAVDHP